MAFREASELLLFVRQFRELLLQQPLIHSMEYGLPGDWLRGNVYTATQHSSLYPHSHGPDGSSLQQDLNRRLQRQLSTCLIEVHCSMRFTADPAGSPFVLEQRLASLIGSTGAAAFLAKQQAAAAKLLDEWVGEYTLPGGVVALHMLTSTGEGRTYHQHGVQIRHGVTMRGATVSTNFVTLMFKVCNASAQQRV